MFFEVFLLGVILYILWNIFKKPSNYPPGPWGLPLFGSIPFDLSKIEIRLEELRRKHGPVISWRIGTCLFVFLCEPKLIKEAFQSQTFIDRPDFKAFSFIESDKKIGMVVTNGPHWHNIRRFTLRHLRDLGMGKSKIVSAVLYEAKELVKVMKKQAGVPGPLPEALTPVVINVLWQMIASKRYELDDQEVIGFERLIQKAQESSARLTIQDIFPWIKNILPETIFNYIIKKQDYSKLSDALKSNFQSMIDEHLKILDKNNPRDFIDDYLIEMDKQKNNPDSTMSIEDLIGCIGDLFTAGLETTSMTINWIVFYLATFQHVQKKLHEEIDEVLPKGTEFTLEHKSRLPYTEAFLSEVFRYSSLASLGGFHTTRSEVNFAGYTIPKDAVVLPFLGSVHYNPKYFDSPQEFQPERFINSDGKFETPKEGLLPFGVGKRQCIGESLARMELFIFMTTMLQELHFSTPPNKSLDLTRTDVPFLRQPKINQDIIITIR
ncbi:UNVERIFIED_CONTAM: hypothetical protein RMT77_009731 [Armadillidium vulgare]